MSQETSTQTRVLNNTFGRPPKGERRVRFADSMGMELVSIFLFELINEYFHNQDSRTRRHQLKLMGHSHNQSNSNSESQLKLNGNINNNIQSKPTNRNSNHYSNNDGCQPSKVALVSNSYNKSGTNTSTSIYQTHNNNYNYHANSYTSNYSSYNSHKRNFNQHSYSYTCNGSSNHTSSSNQYNYSTTSNPNTNTNNNNNSTAKQEPSYICEFTQPISLLSFKERVRLNKVHLETCQISSTAGHVSVSCTIRVLNLSYDKSVIVRYTTDDWRTHTDSLASYKPGSSDGWSDKFTSTFTVTNQVQSFQVGKRIIFAIRCVFDGSDAHWDNNGGLNYAIKRQQ